MTENHADSFVRFFYTINWRDNRYLTAFVKGEIDYECEKELIARYHSVF